MPAPKQIIELVERFERNIDEYKSGRYKEAQIRKEFIDPFFEALGWDVNNRQGYAPAYREVINEDSLSVGEWTKAPDYCFRIGKERKFFLEAKKPSVNVKEEISPAYQLRRYAWSAKLPLSILSDFEEFAIYDCRIKPVKTNGAAVARIMYLTYKDYIEKWDEIAGIFSREAVLKGSFDKYAESGKKKRGTAAVDDEFLKEIESWRELLAKNIADNNQKLSQRELNYAVQATIDRIIFLRICEDRRIEDYGKLMALQNGSNSYERLCELFQQADIKYDSGLFYFHEEKERAGHPDELTLRLKIDDKPIKEIIKGLYYPDSPYQFDFIPVEILGQVYEQFLGKVIHLTESHRAVIEEKPEVRKAGGVYYTPKYIVDYIVKNTVGKLLEGKTPKQAAKLKILDPACGSGSFLIGAYQYLLDWHREWYVKEGALAWAKKKVPVLYQDSQGDWQLTIAEKKRIMVDNIFGVDIDSQAVEVTKLSLLLKVMEGETSQTINSTIRMFHERVLPDLGNNIKCGNSLIGSDFYDNKQMSLLGEEEKYRINTFDWNTEFKGIMDEGGFDAVIGNPPWVSLTGKFGNDILTNEEIAYLVKKHGSNTYMPNLYENFIWQGLSLVKIKGLFSFIVPDRLGFNNQFIKLRKYLLDKWTIISLLYKAKFPYVIADTLIYVIKNGINKNSRFTVGEYGRDSQTKEAIEYYENDNYVFSYETSRKIFDVIKRIESGGNKMPLSSVFSVTSGFGGKSDKITSKRINIKQIEIIKGKNVHKYAIDGKLYFEFIKGNITGRTTDKSKLGMKEKILLRKTGFPIYAAYDNSGIFPEQSLYFMFNKNSKSSYLFYLAILNSKLFQFYYWNRLATNRETTPQLKKDKLDMVPLPGIDMNQNNERKQHDYTVNLVNKMIKLNGQILTAKLPQEKESLQRQIDATDKQIDQLVYKLYGLTEEEIGVVEENDK